MKSKKNIVLVGMMGAGKSSIGKLLAKKIGLEFIDIDKLIEEKEDKNIVDIFKLKGEKYFREIEEKISIEKLKNNNQVIALGGGAYLNRNIRKQTLSKSITFWLNWNSSTLIKRIKNNKKRPLVINLKINEIKKLIDERSKIYISSDYKINCDKFDKLEIVEKINNLYESS
tara:strand:+ start:210 stop:722 length:513 start_codon:yes stop_codon:yes gene_type:complete